MSSLIYSQRTYPQKSILDKDTVIIITQDQEININKDYAKLDYLQELTDSLTLLLDSSFVIMAKSKYLIDSKNNEITLLKQLSEFKSNEIQALRDNAIEQRKRNKYKLIMTSLISISIGVIIAAIL